MNVVRIWRRWVSRLPYLAFYIALDAATGVITYAISAGEPELTRGQLMIRVMTAMVLANAIVGGPDIMLYWRESGRRIEAEEERDAVAKERDSVAVERDAVVVERDAVAVERDAVVVERDAVVVERDAAAQRADAAEQDRDSLREEIRELRATVEQLQNGRGVRRSRRRRRLRNNGR